MSPDDHEGFERAKTIFLEVCDLEPAERQARLDEECAADSKLRRDVERLLDGDANPVLSASDTLRVGLEEMLMEEPAEPPIPEAIDDYRIMRRLGEGGMGTVYLAEQDSPRRLVALKMIRAGYATDEYRARMRREAETLARLQHPGIAQIYDAGVTETDSGPMPYIVMEYIEGPSLLDYAKRERLSTADRLTLFTRVCEAVAHAHQKGVIHRDLKPENILVQDLGTTSTNPSTRVVGHPKVLDFGIARLTDVDPSRVSLLTIEGSLIGTLPYMSPEQVSGEALGLDTRTDIYSLGVVLFELLTGRLPIPVGGTSMPEAIRRVREEEPTRLGTLDKKFRGDLETISAHALEKDADRRYSSVAELAADIRRFLTDEPITARSPSSIYQLSKFVRRNKGLAIGMSTAIAVLIAGFIVSTVLYFDAKTAEAAQAKEAYKAIAIRDYILSDMLAAVSPWKLGIEVKVADVLAMAVPRVDEAFADHPETAAAIRHTLGSAYASLGQDKRAIELLRRAWTETQQLLGPSHEDTLAVRYSLARGLFATDDLEEAQSHFAALRDAGFPAQETDRVCAESVEMSLGHIRSRNGDAGGLKLASAALDRAEKRLGARHVTVIALRGRHLEILEGERDLDRAESLARKQLEAISSDSGQITAREIQTQGLLGSVLFNRGKYEQGRKILEQLVDATGKQFGQQHLITIKTIATYGSMLSDVNDIDRATLAFGKAYEGYRQSLGANHAFTLQVKNNQAILLRKQGKLDEAERMVREVLAARRELDGSDQAGVAQSLDVLGVIQLGRRDNKAALASFTEADGILTKLVGAEHYTTVELRYNLAATLERLGDFKKAEVAFRGLVDSFKRIYGPDHPFVGEALHRTARCCHLQNRLEDAEHAARAAFEFRRRVLPDSARKTYDSECQLGIVLLDLGRGAEGEPHLLSARRGYEGIGRTKWAVGKCVYQALIAHYEREGQTAKAEEARAAEETARKLPR